MKTSNKILSALLIIGFGILVASQIALRQKYLNNDFISSAKDEAAFYDEYSMKDIHHVRILGIAECQLIPGDSVKLSVEKSTINYVRFNVASDTLTIYGNYSSPHSANYKLNRAPQKIKLYLPVIEVIEAHNSNIDVKGSKASEKARSYYFDLDNCNLFTRKYFFFDSGTRYFDTVFIKARNNSEVALYKKEQVKEITLDLKHSLFNDHEANIEQLNIVTDTSSTVISNGKNIGKINNTGIR